MVKSRIYGYIGSMKKYYGLILFLLVLYTAAAQPFELKTGLGLEFYGFHAEDEYSSIDSQYTSIGLDLGASYRIDRNWDLTAGIFLGMPRTAAVYLDGALYSEPDLESYNLYAYFINLTAGGSYIFEWNDFFLSLGPVLNVNDFVLASREKFPAMCFPILSGWGCGPPRVFSERHDSLCQLKGSWNFMEMLVIHDDFAYAYEAGLNLGLVWRM